MNRLISFLTLFFLGIVVSYAQDDQVLFTVEGKPVTVQEFKYIYEKSNNKNADYSKKSLQESLDLYTRFKLKVAKARALRLDTTASLVTELAGYKKQLADSYLTDKEISEKLAKQFYERSNYDVRISHIFIDAPMDMAPADTLAKFKLVQEISKKIKAGESFETLVKTYSEDPNSKNNIGDLGYFTALFPNGFLQLENSAYSLKVGEVGTPVRSALGWHIVKLVDKRPARGEMEIAQILIRVKKGEDKAIAAKKIDTIYSKLLKGENFTELAKQYSEDQNTAIKGGYLGFAKINQYDLTFEQAYSKLTKNGDFTKPIETELGYHIIQRISKPEKLPFDANKKSYLNQIAQNERFEIGRKQLENKIKLENKFTVDQKNYKLYLDSVNSDNIFNLDWKAPKLNDMTLFTLGDRKFGSDDFSQFMTQNSRKRVRMAKSMMPTNVLEIIFNDWVSAKVMEFEQGNLDKKYPDYRSLTREYEEGFLFFEVTNKEVWSKASQDSIGINDFYNQHKDMYKWEERAEITTYDIEAETPEQLSKMIKYISDNNNQSILKKYDNKDHKFTKSTEIIEKSQQNEINGLTWAIGSTITSNKPDNKNAASIRKITALFPVSNKELKDAKGFVIADYQDFLDKKWVEDLKKEYKIKVNQNVFDSLVKK